MEDDQDVYMRAYLVRLIKAARVVSYTGAVDGDSYITSADSGKELRKALADYDWLCEQRDHEMQRPEDHE